jgi:hypothetical protein
MIFITQRRKGAKMSRLRRSRLQIIGIAKLAILPAALDKFLRAFAPLREQKESRVSA